MRRGSGLFTFKKIIVFEEILKHHQLMFLYIYTLLYAHVCVCMYWERGGQCLMTNLWMLV